SGSARYSSPRRSLRRTDQTPRRWFHLDRCRLRSPAPTRGLREASPNSLLRDRDWVRHWDPRHALALPIKPSSRRRRRRASISRDHAYHILPLQIVLALFLDSLSRHSLTSTSAAP